LEESRHGVRLPILPNMNPSAGRERTLEAVGRLAGGVAHDLNNALLPLIAYGEIALEKLADDEDIRPEVEEMMAAANRAAALARRLLAFAGRQVLREDLVDLDELVLRLAQRFAPPEGSSLRLVARRHHRPVFVIADRELLQQVIVELVANAHTAMPEGGTLTLEVWAESGHACVSVRDTGRGLDAETAAHVFEPFFSPRGDSDGWGLGLASAYGIVTQSGGTMSVESEPGRGTEFEIRLPLLAEPRAA
jgi:signal transduction histidine kinase